MLKNILSFLETHERKIIIVSIIFLLSKMTGLLINQSESLEGKVFLLLKSWPYKTGHIVGLEPNLLKKVGGREGDKIHIHENEIFVGDLKIGPLFDKTSRGDSLNPLQTREIPKGKVFVFGTHPRSFDSRYLEFGLVDERRILGKAIRVF